MKKLLFLSLFLSIAIGGYSQEKASIDKFKLVKFDDANFNRATDDATNFNNPVNMARSTDLLSPTETILGTTWYDLFSNYNTGNRFWRFEDGTMAAVWMLGFQASAFPDRGTAYNYYNGSNWGSAPTTRIESIRCGWPNITAWGTAGEIGVSHNGVAGLEFIRRSTKGSGTWTQTNFLGPTGIENVITWPRLIASGNDNEYTHVIASTNGPWQGQTTTIVYSRSDNGGTTWNPHNIVIPELNENHYREITQDKYVFASNGNTVCILYIDAYTDLFYLRSDDNGTTWTRNIVWEHPILFYDPGVQFIDTIFTPDFSGHMAIDNNGHAHVVFGITRYINDASGAGFYAFNPMNDGIVYWNDTMASFSNNYNALAPPAYGFPGSELIEDENYIGWMQDVDGDGEVTLEGVLPIRTYGMSTQPAIHIDEYGYKYVIWSSNTETYVNPGVDFINYRHIWARGYDNASGSGNWGAFMDLTLDIAHIFDDCVYPMIAKLSDDNIHYIYQADLAPGNALDGDHDYHENRWIHGYLPKTDLTPNWPSAEAPDIDVNPTSMTINQGTNNSFNIQNLGDMDLSIDSITDDQAWLSTSGYPSTPFIIIPLGSQDVTVDIDWGILGSVQQTGIVTINSNDPDEPAVTVSVTAIPYPSPDLIVQNQSIFPVIVNPGDTISSSCEVMNVGTMTSDSCILGYYLSLDTFWDTSDTFLDSVNIDTLQVGEICLKDKDLIIPGTSTPGIFFILFFVDPNDSVDEGNEGNNVSHSLLTITDLPVELPDLIVQNQGITPSAANPGDTIDASGEVMNIGVATSDSCKLKYYLSEDMTWDVSDTLLGTDEIDTLQAGEMSLESEDLIIPSSTIAGTYYILFFADADEEVDEEDEGNNVSYSQLTVTITAPYIIVEPAVQNVGYAQGNFGAMVLSNIDWDVQEDCPWLICDPTSGQNNGPFTVEHQQNTTGEVRTCSIIVSGDGVTDTLLVVQDHVTSIAENETFGNMLVYPNPFSTNFTLEYTLSNPSMVMITVYNHLGEIADIISERQQEGKQKIEWDFSDLADGLYFYKIAADGESRVGRIVKMR